MKLPTYHKAPELMKLTFNTPGYQAPHRMLGNRLDASSRTEWLWKEQGDHMRGQPFLRNSADIKGRNGSVE